ncbi:MAG TPA: UDP binding domain-containing protein, partial [Vicinamibacteria bacterium]
IEDVRESPALDILNLLEAKGASISYSDPFEPDIALNGTTLRSLELLPAVDDADVVVIVTDHTGLPYAQVVERAKAVVDTRNATRGIHSPKVVKL